MPRDTKFSEDWLKRSIVDEDGEIKEHLVSVWCEACPDDIYFAYCKLCNKRFSIANMGFGQIQSHAQKNRKHKGLVKSYLHQQSVFVIPPKKEDANSSSLSNAPPVLSLKLPTKHIEWIPSTLNDKVLKSEALILLTAIKCNLSFSSINDLGKLMPIAFNDSEIAKNVKLSDAKARYLTKFGLAPYFQEKIFSDILHSRSFFTLYFDETSTKQVKKQLDIYIGYWSEKHEKVVIHYCDSFFLGHADAEKIMEKVMNFISEHNLRLDCLLQCSMDGPRVNLCFQKKMNSHLASESLENLIDIGTCTLHIVHNALKKGVEDLKCDVESFVLTIFQWFKMSAARREDYHKLQETSLENDISNHFFLRHVENRWLTLGPVCERILEQYEVLKEYFLVFLPKENTKVNEKYTIITSFLKDSKSLLYLHFVVFLCYTFDQYLTMFQKETPLVHVLYKKQNDLIRSIMYKFLKSDIVGQKEGLSLKNIECDDANNWMPLKKIDVGSAVKKLLKFPDDKDFLHNARRCLIKVTNYLKDQLPFTNPLLRDLQFIAPHYHNDPKSKDAISRIAEQMTKVVKTDELCDKIKSEYSMLLCENLDKEKEIYDKDFDICKYWSSVSKKKDTLGNEKYSNLSKLIKACLSLSHGNSTPERGFSVNNNIVTAERNSLSEIGIKSLRICKDFLKNLQSVSDIIVTQKMINSMKKARAEYASYLEKVKEERKAEVLKRKMEEEAGEMMLKKKAKEDLQGRLTELMHEETELNKQQETSHSLLNDATQKLENAVKNRDFSAIKVAQMMLNAANDNIKDVSEKLCILKKDIADVQKKMSNI